MRNIYNLLKSILLLNHRIEQSNWIIIIYNENWKKFYIIYEYQLIQI